MLMNRAEVLRDVSKDITEITVKIMERYEMYKRVIGKEDGEREHFIEASTELEERMKLLNRTYELFRETIKQEVRE